MVRSSPQGYDRGSLHKLLVYIWTADARTSQPDKLSLTPILQVGCFYLAQHLWENEAADGEGRKIEDLTGNEEN